MAIGEIEGNRESLERLQKFHREKSVVPFIGAGFSKDVCPGWEEFLENFFENLKEGSMEAKDIAAFEELRKSADDNRFEAMAQLLNQCAEHLGFKQAMEKAFKKNVIAEKQKKFRLLNKIFPCLKITTNFDCLIEDKHDRHIDTIKGNRRDDLQKALNPEIDNTLVKIHGCVRDATTFILTKEQYDNHYGPGKSIDENRPLPSFLISLFKNRHLLFIGCSLQADRWLKLLDGRPNIPEHFAIIKQKKDKEEQMKFARRLSRHMITPIWIEDYAQIEEILELLKPAEQQYQLPSHNITFVGREEHLERMEKLINEKGKTGQVQVISGRLLNLEGAGGIGKTTLAIEAANRFHQHFPDGVFGPIIADEHSPQSFTVYLSRLLDNPQDEPRDNKSAQRTITSILKNKQALIILDNAVKWDDLQYMIPSLTKSTILLTTRDREMGDHLRLRYRDLTIEKISLEIFTKSETIALFKTMLADQYSETDHDLYLEIAQSLGYLPIALSQAISLILFGPHYSPKELRDKLASDKRLDLLRKGQTLDPTSDNRPIEAIFDLSSDLLTDDLIKTLQYLATCAHGPIPLDFLHQLTQNSDIQLMLEQLNRLSWCQRHISSSQRCYQIHQLVRELIRQRFKKLFANDFLNLVHKIFANSQTHFTRKDILFPQLEESLTIAKKTRDTRLLLWVDELFKFCQIRGHGDFYLRLCGIIQKYFPEKTKLIPSLYSNQAHILKRYGQLEVAMELYKNAELINFARNKKSGLAKCYSYQGDILRNWGKLEEAMQLYEKAKGLFKEIKGKKGLLVCSSKQADIFRQWGKLNKAIELYEKVESMLINSKDRLNLANCYTNKANILRKWGKSERAITVYRKAEKINIELNNRLGLAENYYGLSEIFRKVGKLEKAIELQKKVEELYRELGKQLELAGSYYAQAVILKERLEFNEALKFHKKAENIYIKFGSQIGLAGCYIAQAELLKGIGRFSEAIRLQKKAEEKYIELNDMQKLAGSYYLQSEIFKDMGKLEEALDAQRRAEDIYLSSNNRSGLAGSYYGEAEILRNLGRLEEAIEKHQKAEEIYLELENIAAVIGSYNCRTRILIERGHLLEAIQLQKETEKICMKVNNQLGLAGSYYIQAGIQKKLSNSEEALNLQKKAEGIYKNLGNEKALAGCYYTQAGILIEFRDFEEAIHFQKKAEKIYEKLGNSKALAESYYSRLKTLRRIGRIEESERIQEKLEEMYKRLGPQSGLTFNYTKVAATFMEDCQYRKALEYYEKECQICRHFNYTEGLINAGIFKASVLQKMGNLKEALQLYEQHEEKCKNYNDDKNLAFCYGKRAIILKAYGRLEEAMSLHKEEEKIYLEIEDEVGLSRSYSCQARILRRLGKQCEAMQLHKKEEGLKLELGDKVGLAICYTKQAMIFSDWEQYQTAIELLKKAERIFKKYKKQEGLSSCYMDQSIVFQKTGCLHKSMALLKKVEELNTSAGYKMGLAESLWEQGKIYHQWGDRNKQILAWEHSIIIKKNGGIPITEDERALDNIRSEKVKEKIIRIFFRKLPAKLRSK
jgi:tetratricopeptide (TPR) repeat protein